MKNWNYIEGAKTGNAGITDKEFNSENDLRRWCIEHNYTYTPVGGGYYRLEDDSGKNRRDLEAHVKAGNKKVGNQKVDNTWTPEQALKYYEDAKKANDQNKMDEIKEIIRQEKNGAYKYYQELQSRKDDIIHNNSGYGKVAYYKDAKRKFEAWQNVASKVGNVRYRGNPKYMNIPGYKQELERINRTYEKEFEQDKREREKGMGKARSEAQVNEYWDRQAKALDIYYADKTKTGNETLHKYATSKPRVINEDKTGAEEFFKKLSDDVKEREKKDDADIEKVGNSSVSGGTFKSEVGNAKTGNAKDKNDKDIKVGDFVNVTGKKGKVTKIIGDVVEVFFDNSGTYYPDRTDRYYASECTKIGNSKTGNVASEYEILKQDPSKMHPMYKKAYEEAMKKLAREDEEFKKRFEKEYGVKAKNEASDDKFAYVMREFDEGKLKTPDGKVVTDPAQAKAIAYSESKKTENGLARARNAMK